MSIPSACINSLICCTAISASPRAASLPTMPSSTIAFGLIYFVSTSDSDVVPALGGTTALLLLGVFTIVNIAVLVLRRDDVGHDHFHAPSVLPVVGAFCCAFLVGPWTDRDTVQYKIAAGLLALGVVLWVGTWFWNRAVRAKPTGFRDVDDLDG